MNQKTVIQNESVCGNKNFYKCSVDESTCKCVNCGKQYTSHLKEGDHVVGECRSCDRKDLEVIIDYTYTSGGYSADCLACHEAYEAIGELYDDFRGEGYGFEVKEDGSIDWKSFSNEKFLIDREAGIEKIVNLPKEHLKVFLRGIHHAVER